jgi:hypothetical protein
MFTPLRVALAFAGALTLGMAPCAAAQKVERTAKNVVYAEVAGNAVTHSVNYERFITHNLAVRVGVNALEAVIPEDEPFIAAVMLTLVSGRSSSHAELGLGARYASGDRHLVDMRVKGVYATGTLGYRFQRPEGGWVARAGVTPVLMDGSVFPWIGLSFGYAF